MSDRVYVGTRKGLFALNTKDLSIELVGFLGDPVSAVFADNRDQHLYAALEHGHFGVKLHRSSDRGGTWEEVSPPAFEGEKHVTPETFGQPLDYDGPSVAAIWTLEAAGDGREGTLWCGTVPGALFHSSDRGDTWTLNDAFWSIPGRDKWIGPPPYEKPTINTVLVDPRNSDDLVMGTTNGVWKSKDAGASWQVSGPGMYMEAFPPEMAKNPEMQDPHRIAQCAAAPDVLWVQHHNGVFRSTNRGDLWEEITSIQPSKFGFAVAAHPSDPERAWFIPGVKDECRVPVDGKVVVARTQDGGKSFDVLRNGLPQENAYDLVFRHALDIDTSGDCLAFGSTTGSLWYTEDQGDAWREMSSHLPPVYCVHFA